MDIGSKISLCRKEKGLSQEALATELGISRQAVSRWETGESVHDLEKLKMLCGIFQVSADYLLFDKIERKPEAPTASGQSDHKKNLSPKERFRMVIYIVITAVGTLLIVSALLLSLIETYQPYQEYYASWGPFGTYLFRTWRVVPLILGISAFIIGIRSLWKIYRKM